MGVKITQIERGNGREAAEQGDFVIFHWTGFGKYGDMSHKFFSTKDEMEPYMGVLGENMMLEGMDKCITGMRVGGVALLECTSDCAFGEGEIPIWGITANANVNFEIEVLSISWPPP